MVHCKCRNSGLLCLKPAVIKNTSQSPLNTSYTSQSPGKKKKNESVNTIPLPPPQGKRQNQQGRTHGQLVRKNVLSLSSAELRSLVLAMKSLQEDDSADGFQSLAAFHALPPLCPNPEANERFACCIHGMATFPHWHRLYNVQMEDALRRHGALVGIPYFDTVEPVS